MRIEPDRLKLGKGVAFVKSRLRRLPQDGDVWEADFQPESDYWTGLVVEKTHGFVFAEEQLENAPDVNDLATLLAHAMRRPLVEVQCHRPRRIRLRNNPRWQQLVAHLEELAIEVVFDDNLAKWDAVASDRDSFLKTLWLSLRGKANGPPA